MMRERLIKGGEAFGYPVSALRTEARKGRLALIRVAGKDYVTADAIREMERLCRSTVLAHASTSASEKDSQTSTSSGTERVRLVQAAALNVSKMLCKNYRNTSKRTSGPTPSNVISLASSAEKS